MDDALAGRLVELAGGDAVCNLGLGAVARLKRLAFVLRNERLALFRIRRASFCRFLFI